METIINTREDINYNNNNNTNNNNNNENTNNNNENTSILPFPTAPFEEIKYPIISGSPVSLYNVEVVFKYWSLSTYLLSFGRTAYIEKFDFLQIGVKQTEILKDRVFQELTKKYGEIMEFTIIKFNFIKFIYRYEVALSSIIFYKCNCINTQSYCIHKKYKFNHPYYGIGIYEPITHKIIATFDKVPSKEELEAKSFYLFKDKYPALKYDSLKIDYCAELN